MRLVAIALLACLLAGCLQGGSPAPASSTPAVGGGTPTPSPTSTTPSTTPGSSPPMTGGPGPGGAMMVRPAEGTNTSDGFTLSGKETVSLIVPGQNVTFAFVGSVDAGNATALSAPCDGGNPRVEIRDENGTTLDLQGPHMRCMVAMTWQHASAGDRFWANLTWDGTAWNGTAIAPVPEGTYYAVATLLVQREGAEKDVTLQLPVGVTQNRGAL